MSVEERSYQTPFFTRTEVSAMIDCHDLHAVLTTKLPFHRARINCLTQIILAMVSTATVRLPILALAFGGTATAASSYRRLQRFFAEVDLSVAIVGRVIASLVLQGRSSKVLLCMDRTEWHPLDRRINLLVVSLCIDGLCVPVAWHVLPDGAGNSSSKQRIAVMQKVLRLIPKHRITALLADREFFGTSWMQWLCDQEIPFCIRLRKNAAINTGTGFRRVDQVFETLPHGTTVRLAMPEMLYGVPVYVTARRRSDGQTIYLASSWEDTRAMRLYRKRWNIEVLFQALKGRGFDLEATGITKPERIERLFAVLALAYTWALLAGRWRETTAPRRTGAHGRARTSLFRYGADMLRRTLLQKKNKKLITLLVNLMDVKLPNNILVVPRC